ncbi:endonuclease domain-containing 1 protein-like [Chaetodon auriga]|uniref:endonuclease domain-containing 1 protein-like n=1 Tax=Chaetodon auriga TaxID=39042 RepID=UPI004032A050
MLQLSTGALFLLLLWFGGLVLGEISNDFSQCLDFFYNKTPPKGISAAGYQPICQRYKNQYRFASLYHRQHRTPLYSAYILSPADGKRPRATWMYEPQVSDHYFRMSQRKMLQFSTASLFLLLPWIGGPVIAEIDSNFSKCLKFFYEETPPQGISISGYQPICQRYKNKYRFASLYNCQHRAPLYSAYTLSSGDGKRPIIPWMYEPQLVSRQARPDMQPFPSKNQMDRDVVTTQAVVEDYKNSDYTKGHLNPSMHHKTKDDRESTFTLTNIVPQREGSNCGPWRELENEVLRKFKAYCKGPMYVITGVMPYNSAPRWINNRVSVPEYMWSAYCCRSYSTSLPESEKPFFPTYAAVGRNDPNSGEEIVPVNVNAKASVRGYDVRGMSLETLEGILRTRLRMPVSLFKGQCQ